MNTTITAAIVATPERIAAVEALVARAAGLSPESVPALVSFTGRDDYLGFVAAWKVVYAGEAEAIRAHKRAMRDQGSSDDARGLAQSRRHYARARAHGALLLRAAGKDLARASRRPSRAEAA